MNSEEEIIIAFLYKRSGKKELKEPEISLLLSLELDWFTSKQANDFVKYCLNQKLLEKKEELLVPNFDIDIVKVPVGFQPSKKSFDIQQKTTTMEHNKPLDMIIKSITEKTKQNENELTVKIKKLEEEKEILPEIAALMIAIEHNVEIKGFLNLAEKEIIIENEE